MGNRIQFETSARETLARQPRNQGRRTGNSSCPNFLQASTSRNPRRSHFLPGGSFDIGLNQLDDAGCVEVAVAIGIVDRKRDCGTPQGTVESQSL